MRFSSYTIISEPLPKGGYALLNGLTGAVDLVSEDIAEIIIDTINNSGQKTAFISTGLLPPETMEAFKERGHITELSPDTERSCLSEIASVLHEHEAKNPRFVIVPNMDCNYRCTYCFEQSLQKSLDRYQKSVMDFDQIGKVYNSIKGIQERTGSKGGEIILYGGEPLDAKNMDIVNGIINHKDAKDFKFFAVTNGHDLDKFIFILGHDKLGMIQVSIDGPKQIHDKRRISRQGDSSFDKIVSNIRKVTSQTDAKINLRVHLDSTNLDSFEELLDTFVREGWVNHERILIYLSIVYRKNDQGAVQPVLDIVPIIKRLEHVTAQYSNIFIGASQTNADSLLTNSLDMGKPYRLRTAYCSANSGMYVFLPDGYVYSCWESIGKECSKIGHYMTDEGLVLDKKACDKWTRRSVASIPECLDCPYCLVCAGGCSQYAEYNSGSVMRPFCDNFQQTYPGVLARSVEHFLVRNNL